ncbi:Bifunctional protein PaaZ [Rosistilla carotiformis]|uniref:Bifunctional protein PaaZ n=1 Tax=Rosistilla carotiformis TaxID=2528017 RepID=A0A518JWM0_9BACT|nr:MaoC/PaaZ C-terminal domain-containing protein [Rosistilla carotiformis]QDV69940.1 Bifunctional protein PaaZ [Rosistilla carotiformis]
MNETLYLEDLHKGDHWVSPSRTITRDQVIGFADLTGDHDPLHVDEDFARKSAFRKPIAHGLLGLSIMAGLSSNHPQVHTIAFTDLEDWQFKHPIFFGDTVHVETEIIAIQPHGRRAGKVTWFRQLINQSGLVVQQGSLVTIVAAKTATKVRRKATEAHESV